MTLSPYPYRLGDFFFRSNQDDRHKTPDCFRYRGIKMFGVENRGINRIVGADLAPDPLIAATSAKSTASASYLACNLPGYALPANPVPD
jgi:hypothetical protein